MNVLILGGGGGSWQMRGVQLGRAIGAHVTSKPTANDFAFADVVVLVKHGATQFAKEAKAWGGPVVWDVLDVWEQPDQNQDTKDQHVARIRKTAEAANVSLLIGATQAMAEDIGGVYLPHHARIGLKPTQPKVKATTVAYDGQVKYLGQWKKLIERACKELGLTFVVNPPDLRKADVLVSFRGGKWDGWACQQWKSGVKFVNAVVSGRPIVSGPSAAEQEINAVGCVTFSHSGLDLSDTLQAACAFTHRTNAYESGLRRSHEFCLDTIAATYKDILRHAAERRAA